MPEKALITGAMGQIGTDLIEALAKELGVNNVIATDIKAPKTDYPFKFERLDITDVDRLKDIVIENKISTIYHLASLLSATGENKPDLAWHINMQGLINVINISKDNNIRVFTPSSIAVFGPNTPKENTPQDTIKRPNTMYGITKLSGELLCDYYVNKYNMDIRGLRFPGIISWKGEPGGGTTDYAVHIYYDAIKHKSYRCPLSENTKMDMMYMDDAVHSIISLMSADKTKLKHYNAFNITSFAATPKDFENAIKANIKDFKIIYEPNPLIQSIADSWPDSVDDSCAREQWGWKPLYDINKITEDMLSKLYLKLGNQ